MQTPLELQAERKYNCKKRQIVVHAAEKSMQNNKQSNIFQNNLVFVCHFLDFAADCLLTLNIMQLSWITPPLHGLLLYIDSIC